MSIYPSRRRFLLSAGLATPVAGLEAAPAAPKFEYRPLGMTGMKPTAVGFGCMITSDPTVIEKAADIGINYFDTARGYQNGNNERMVGAALKNYRKKVYISTKTHAETKVALLEDLETSLKELGTDYIDIWYMHAKSKPEDLTDEHFGALEEAKKQGKVRFGGFSTHSGQTAIIPALAKNPHVDVILVAYNFTMDAKMADVVAEARKAGKGIVGMKVMAGGFRRLKPSDPLYSKFQKDGALVAALKWVLKNKDVDTTIPSMTDMDQLDENLRAMSEPFNESDEGLLARQLEHIGPLYCRTCGSCSGKCPQGLPVSDMLRYLSYADGYGQFQLARENYLSLPQQVRDVRCGDCSDCAIACPNGVRVASRLQRAQELLS